MLKECLGNWVVPWPFLNMLDPWIFRSTNGCQLHLSAKCVGHKIGLLRIVLQHVVKLRKEVLPTNLLWNQLLLSLQVARCDIVNTRYEPWSLEMMSSCAKAIHHCYHCLLLDRVMLFDPIQLPWFKRHLVSFLRQNTTNSIIGDVNLYRIGLWVVRHYEHRFLGHHLL